MAVIRDEIQRFDRGVLVIGPIGCRFRPGNPRPVLVTSGWGLVISDAFGTLCFAATRLNLNIN